MNLTICPAYDRPEEVKALFLEYTDFLLKSDPSFAAFLELQNYDRELDHLEEKYGMPKGRLYLALVDDAIAGCIALRPLSGGPAGPAARGGAPAPGRGLRTCPAGRRSSPPAGQG